MKRILFLISIIISISTSWEIPSVDDVVNYTKDTYDEYSKSASNKFNIYLKKKSGGAGEYLALQYYEILGWEELNTTKQNPINGYDLALTDKRGNLLIVEVKSSVVKKKKFVNRMLAKTPIRGKQMSRKWVKSHANSLAIKYKRKIIKNQYNREVFFFNFKDLSGSIHKVKGINNTTIQYANISLGDLIKKISKKNGRNAIKFVKKYKKILKVGVIGFKACSEGFKESASDPMTYVIAVIGWFASDYLIDLLVDELDNIISEEESYIKNDDLSKLDSKERGEIAFNKGSCSECHTMGEVKKGPDLTGVLSRHENGEKWVFNFIKDPSAMNEDPYIRAMIEFFNLEMPNPNINDNEILDIIEYFKSFDDAQNSSKDKIYTFIDMLKKEDGVYTLEDMYKKEKVYFDDTQNSSKDRIYTLEDMYKK